MNVRVQRHKTRQHEGQSAEDSHSSTVAMAQLLHQTLTQLVFLDEGEHVPETQAGRRPIINHPIANHEGHVGEKQILSNHKWRLTHFTVHGSDLTFEDDQAKTKLNMNQGRKQQSTWTWKLYFTRIVV